MLLRTNMLQVKKLAFVSSLAATIILTLLCQALGSELMVSKAFEVTPGLSSSEGQYSPQVAFGGADTYLVVWEQGKDVWQDSKAKVFASRVRVSNGIASTLDPGGILLSRSGNSQKRPRVAFGGGVFLVVWQELSASTDYDIRGARVTLDGRILDPEGISITMKKLNQITPNITYDKTNNRFFVVWADFISGTNYQIYGARIGANGSVLDSNGIFLAKEDNLVPHTPVVETNGEQFLVAWTKRVIEGYYSGISAKRFALNGSLLGKAFSDNVKVRVGRHNAIGKIPPLSGIVSNGDSFVVLTHFIYGHGSDWRPLGAFHVRRNGTVRNQEVPLMIDSYEKTFGASAVFTGEFYLAVWEGIGGNNRNNVHTEPNHDIFACRIDSNIENALDYDAPILIADTPSSESNPSISKGNGPEMIVAYEEDNLLDHPLGRHIIKAKLISCKNK